MVQPVAEKDLRARSQEILQARLGGLKKAALAAALVPLAVAAAGSGAAADAPVKSPQNHRVKAQVSQAGGVYRYEFTLINASLPGASGGAQGTVDVAPADGGPARPWIVNWQLPLFDPSDVSDVKVPEGWAYEIVRTDAKGACYNNPESPFGKHPWAWSPATDPLLKKPDEAKVYGPNPAVFARPPYILNFYCLTAPDESGRPMPVNPLGSLDMMKGFSFTSKYPATAAPFLPVYYNQQDIASLPGKAMIPDSPGLRKAASVQVSSAN